MEIKKNKKIICLTFDVDCINYLNGEKSIDEFTIIEDIFQIFFNLKIPCTWFIRIDAKTKLQYGSADYFHKKHKRLLQNLVFHKHAIGWHMHSYVESNGNWIQNVNENEVLKEIKNHAPFALMYNLRAFRMGWGFQTNKIIEYLSKLGFLVESSAMPRPKYEWEKGIKDWQNTPQHPYFPSIDDYRISGKSCLPILEVPIAVTNISAPYDTQKIKRYINLAYRPSVFKKADRKFLKSNQYLVTITHPYEILVSSICHPLFGINKYKFIENIEYLKSIENAQFCNLIQLYKIIENNGK